MNEVESFTLDHTKVKAPYVRIAGSEEYKGVKITKYDLRLTQPNAVAISTGILHSLEHILATNIRKYLNGVIDISPMGCRTGFYMILWDEVSVEKIRNALVKTLNFVVSANHIPATSPIECGNYKDHSLWGAKEYAKQILNEGVSSDPFIRKLD